MQRNSVVFGMLYGVAFPIIGFFIFRLFFQMFSDQKNESLFGFESMWDLRTACLLAIAMCIIPVQLFRKKWMYEAMRGTMIVVGVWCIVWFIYFKDTFMNF